MAKIKKVALTAQQIAARRAELFGTQDNETLFPSARVGAAALRAGVAGMVTRTLQAVPYLAPVKGAHSPCKVTFSGSDAFARHRWSLHNGQLQVSGVLNLPAVNEQGTVSRRVADSQCAYALHEAAHFCFTNPQAYAGGVHRIISEAHVSEKAAQEYMNVIEDILVERSLLDAGYAAGFGPLVEKLTGDSVQRMMEGMAGGALKAIKAGGADALRAFPFVVAFGLRGYAPGADALVQALPAPMRAVYDECGAMLDALPSRLGDFSENFQGTTKAADVAVWFGAAMKKLGAQMAANPPAPPSQPEQGEGEPGGDADAPGATQGGADAEGDAGGDADAPGDAEGEGAGKAGAQGEPGGDADAPGDAGGAGKGDGAGDVGDLPSDSGEGGGATESGTYTQAEAIAEALAQPLAVTPAPLQEKHAAEDDDGFSAVMDAASANAVVQVGTTDAIARDAVESHAKQVLRAAPLLANDLRVLLDASATDTREGGKRSGKLRTSALSRAVCGSDTVFERRTFHDGVDTAVTLLCDQSGSMSGHGQNGRAIIIDVQAIAGALAKLLAGIPGVKFELLGFSSTNAEGDGAQGMAAQELMIDGASAGRLVRPCTLRVYKTFAQPLARALGSLGNMGANGGTPDVSALVAASRRLQKQTAQRHILIMLTDGETGRADVIGAALRRIKAQGVIVIGLGISSSVCDGYDYRAVVQSVRDLPKAGLGALFKAVRDDAIAREVRS